MLTEREFKNVKFVLGRIFNSEENDKSIFENSLKQIFKFLPYHYLGARICYFKGENFEDLMSETYEVVKKDIQNFYFLNKEEQNSEKNKKEKSAIKFILNLLKKGHTSIFGTTYSVFILDAKKLEKDFLIKLSGFPKNSFYLVEYGDILFLVLNNRIFAELIYYELKNNKNSEIENLVSEFYTISKIFEKSILEKLEKFNNPELNYYLVEYSDEDIGWGVTYTSAEFSENVYMKELDIDIDKYIPIDVIYKLGAFKLFAGEKDRFLLYRPFEFEFLDQDIVEENEILISGLQSETFFENRALNDEKMYGGENRKKFIDLKKSVTSSFWVIWGTDRITTHQIVRHKTLEFLQKSNRYRKVEKEDLEIIPAELLERIKDIVKEHGTELAKNYIDFLLDHIGYLHNKYEYLIKSGVKKEAARFVLPHFQKTNIVVAGINRYIGDFIVQRTQSAAQSEIRLIATAMKLIF